MTITLRKLKEQLEKIKAMGFVKMAGTPKIRHIVRLVIS